jgi:hypothetical protein
MVLANGDPCVIVEGVDGLPVAIGPLEQPQSGDPVVIIQGADGKPVVAKAFAVADGDPVMLVNAADGRVVAIAFGGEEPTSCPDGTSPEILLTVTGDFASVPNFDYVQWCGKTWNVGDSGLQQIACPGSYRRTQLYCTDTGDTGGFWYTEFWTYGGTKRNEIYADLWMRRQYRMLDKAGGWERGYIPEGNGCFYDYYGYTTIGVTDACLNVLPGLYTTSTTYNILYYSGRRDKIRWRGETGTALPIAPTTTVVQDSDLGLITTGQTPWATDWRIPDAWFSSTVHNVGGVNITFTWARGNGW